MSHVIYDTNTSLDNQSPQAANCKAFQLNESKIMLEPQVISAQRWQPQEGCPGQGRSGCSGR